MKKSLKSSLKKRSLDISLQHKNEASYKFSKKDFCTWPKTGLALKGVSATTQKGGTTDWKGKGLTLSLTGLH